MTSRWANRPEDDVAAEIGWLAHEALAMMTEHVHVGSPRWREYMDRRIELVAHLDAERTQRETAQAIEEWVAASA